MGACLSTEVEELHRHKYVDASLSGTSVSNKQGPTGSSGNPPSWQSATNGEHSSATVTLGAINDGHLMMASSSDVHIQQQMKAFHTDQHRGLYRMWNELDMLADLHLDSVLGQGGYAVVLHGFWRGSTPVAVKLFATKAAGSVTAEDSNCSSGSMLSLPSSGNASLPVTALFEALLARDLAHPNIIKCYDVRCCKLSRPFITLLRKNAQHKQLNQTTNILRSHTTPCGISQEVEEEDDDDVKQVLRSMTGDELLGTRGSGRMAHVAEHCELEMKSQPEQADQSDAPSLGDVPSMDGFGVVAGSVLPSTGLSWEDVLNKLSASSSDHLTLIVMEHAKCGTLLGAIKSGIFNRPPFAPENEKRRRLRALLRTAREIAMGLEHLHEASVIHGDLKPANVLLTDSRADTRGFQAALADFGLARLVVNNKCINKQVSGTTAFMAPELFRDGEVSCSTDIYAFGITLWELVHGKPAYKDPDPYAIMVAVLHGDRPAWSAPLEAQLVHLARMYRRCVSASPDARPSATELVGELARLEDAARQESQRQSKELMRMQRVSKELARQQPAAWERVNKELPQQGPTALESVL
ncbi:kinase-like domain-containing protein [Haematococcus lacustris]